MDWTKDDPNSRAKTEYLSDKAQTLELSEEYKRVRMIGPSKIVAVHGIRILTKKGKEVTIPKVCLAWDSEAKEYKGKCPYCDIDYGTPGLNVVTNLIDRDEQEDRPENVRRPSEKELEVVRMHGYKCRLKDGKSSKSWTPARLHQIRPSAGGKIRDLTKFNKGKDENGKVIICPPQDPRYGFDMQMNFDKGKSGSDMYGVVKDDKTQLTKEERAYLLWDIDLLAPEDMKTATREAEGLAERQVEKEGKEKKKKKRDDDYDETEDEDNRRTAKKKAKKPTIDDDEDADWEEDGDTEDDEEDEPPRKKKSAKRSRDEDEEDERPAKKKKRPVEEEDEDDDFGDDDDTEEDDEPEERPRKKTADKTKKSSKRTRDEDDDPEEDDDDLGDDDEEEEAPRKKKASASSKTASKKTTKKSKPAEDDWESDDDDGDEDWE